MFAQTVAKLIERDELATLDLSHRLQEIGFLSGRETERLIRTARDDRYHSPLGKRDTLNDNLSVDDGSRGNLSGSRAGQDSVRVNQQWRICFRWERQAAVDVELVDYH